MPGEVLAPVLAERVGEVLLQVAEVAAQRDERALQVVGDAVQEGLELGVRALDLHAGLALGAEQGGALQREVDERAGGTEQLGLLAPEQGRVGARANDQPAAAQRDRQQAGIDPAHAGLERRDDGPGLRLAEPVDADRLTGLPDEQRAVASEQGRDVRQERRGDLAGRGRRADAHGRQLQGLLLGPAPRRPQQRGRVEGQIEEHGAHQAGDGLAELEALARRVAGRAGDHDRDVEAERRRGQQAHPPPGERGLGAARSPQPQRHPRGEERPLRDQGVHPHADHDRLRLALRGEVRQGQRPPDQGGGEAGADPLGPARRRRERRHEPEQEVGERHDHDEEDLQEPQGNVVGLVAGDPRGDDDGGEAAERRRRPSGGGAAMADVEAERDDCERAEGDALCPFDAGEGAVQRSILLAVVRGHSEYRHPAGWDQWPERTRSGA